MPLPSSKDPLSLEPSARHLAWGQAAGLVLGTVAPGSDASSKPSAGQAGRLGPPPDPGVGAMWKCGVRAQIHEAINWPKSVKGPLSEKQIANRTETLN